MTNYDALPPPCSWTWGGVGCILHSGWLVRRKKRPRRRQRLFFPLFSLFIFTYRIQVYHSCFLSWDPMPIVTTPFAVTTPDTDVVPRNRHGMAQMTIESVWPLVRLLFFFSFSLYFLLLTFFRCNWVMTTHHHRRALLLANARWGWFLEIKPLKQSIY